MEESTPNPAQRGGTPPLYLRQRPPGPLAVPPNAESIAPRMPQPVGGRFAALWGDDRRSSPDVRGTKLPRRPPPAHSQGSHPTPQKVVAVRPTSRVPRSEIQTFTPTPSPVLQRESASCPDPGPPSVGASSRIRPSHALSQASRSGWRCFWSMKMTTFVVSAVRSS